MLYQVGQRVPAFCGDDGLFMTVDSSGVFLLCRMSAPTAKERRAFHSRQLLRIHMGEYAGVLYWVVQFGDIPAMDCTYSPQIVPEKPELAIPADGHGYALTVILADGDTGEVLNIRLVGLPHDFSVAMREIVERISAQTIDYQSSISALYRLTTNQLADMAHYYCVM